MSDIIIRELETNAEYLAAEEIQRATWGMPDLEIIPGHALHAMHHSGAALLGAFDGARLVGFTFGILGTQHTPCLLYTSLRPGCCAWADIGR